MSPRHETRPEYLQQRHREVIAFLSSLVGKTLLWKLNPVREFFEVKGTCGSQNMTSIAPYPTSIYIKE
jgi:hypothetical protein